MTTVTKKQPKYYSEVNTSLIQHDEREYNSLLWNKNIAVHGLNTDFAQNTYLSLQCVAAEEYTLKKKHIN